MRSAGAASVNASQTTGIDAACGRVGIANRSRADSDHCQESAKRTKSVRLHGRWPIVGNLNEGKADTISDYGHGAASGRKCLLYGPPMAQKPNSSVEVYRLARFPPFKAGERSRAAVQIVDDQGIESLKIVELT